MVGVVHHLGRTMDEEDFRNDLMRGVKAIADFSGETPRAIFRKVELGLLPVFRVGKTICARKSTLLAYYAALDAQAFQRALRAAGVSDAGEAA